MIDGGKMTVSELLKEIKKIPKELLDMPVMFRYWQTNESGTSWDVEKEAQRADVEKQFDKPYYKKNRKLIDVFMID